MAVIFWVCVSLLLYTYIGYLLLLYFLKPFFRKTKRFPTQNQQKVSLVISAYNEQDGIEAKLKNSLSLNYPSEFFEIIVASDGSTDDTNKIARSYANQGVVLLDVKPRLGKTNAQNQAVRICSGDIIVFTDANSLIQPDAIQLLVRHFDDPLVGCVEGRRLDCNVAASTTAEIELTYRNYETLLKMLESEVGICLGATGPIYAIRKDKYVQLPINYISDLMEPIVMHTVFGVRQVFEPLAISREEVLSDIDREYRRKIRIITRCLNSLFYDKGILNPFKNPLVFFQVTSHRLLRWFAPILIIIALTSNLLLLDDDFYKLTMALAMLFMILTLIGSFPGRLSDRFPIIRFPYYFYKVNLASLMAIINWARGVNIQVWTPER